MGKGYKFFCKYVCIRRVSESIDFFFEYDKHNLRGTSSIKNFNYNSVMIVFVVLHHITGIKYDLK
jgi:hypothetical protein